MEEKGIYGVWLFDEKIKELEERLNVAWEFAERLDEKCDKLEEENEVNRLKAERLEEENKSLLFRVAHEEARNKRLQIAGDKMSKALSEAAALMDSYDELLKKFVELHEKLRVWRGGCNA